MNTPIPDSNIINILNGKDAEKKEITLYALLDSKDKTKYLDEIIACMTSPNVEIRLVATMVLTHINSKKIIPVLEKTLNDKHWKIRAMAAIALAKFKNEKAIPILKSLIQRDIPEHSTHKRAIEALGRYTREDFLNIFEKMLSHRRKASKIKAIEAIQKLGSNKARELLADAEQKETDGKIALHIRSAIQSIDRKTAHP